MGLNHNLLQSRVNDDVPPKQDQTDMPEVTMKCGQHLHFFRHVIVLIISCSYRCVLVLHQLNPEDNHT